jgi:hypothetical protein
MVVSNHVYTMDLASETDSPFSVKQPPAGLAYTSFLGKHGSSSDSDRFNSFFVKQSPDNSSDGTPLGSYSSDSGYTTTDTSYSKASTKEVPFLRQSNILHKRKKVEVSIAIVGGGGAGSVIASLLSNLSDEDEDVIFKITILERSPQIINGSAFETAAILHAGGREYPKDKTTAAQCQMAGDLFKAMFPELYTDEMQPIVFAIDPQSALSPEIQEETHQNAKNITSTFDHVSPIDKQSQYKIPTEILQSTFPNLPSGILSGDDIPMDIFKRNALLKRNILSSKNIVIKTGFEVLAILDKGRSFEIFDKNGQAYAEVFDQVIMTVWDQTKNILCFSLDDVDKPAPVLESAPCSTIDFSKFTVEGRVLALCDISHVEPQKRTPIMTLTCGGMFIPLNDDVALACRCVEGATYPKGEATEVGRAEVLEHGQRIIDGLEVILGKDNGVKLLGARYQHIVRKAETELATRVYEPPIVPQKGIIVGIPPKATFIGSLALQIMEQVLLNLPEACLVFKEKWLHEVRRIVPNDDCLYTRRILPKAFTINIKDELSRVDVIKETLAYFESCRLTPNGEILYKEYKDRLRECELLPQKFFTPPLGVRKRLPSLIVLQRSVSAPLHSDVKSGNATSPTAFSMKVRGVKTRADSMEIRGEETQKIQKRSSSFCVMKGTCTPVELSQATGMDMAALDGNLENHPVGQCDNSQDQLDTSHLQLKTTIEELVRSIFHKL